MSLSLTGQRADLSEALIKKPPLNVPPPQLIFAGSNRITLQSANLPLSSVSYKIIAPHGNSHHHLPLIRLKYTHRLQLSFLKIETNHAAKRCNRGPLCRVTIPSNKIGGYDAKSLKPQPATNFADSAENTPIITKIN